MHLGINSLHYIDRYYNLRQKTFHRNRSACERRTQQPVQYRDVSALTSSTSIYLGPSRLRRSVPATEWFDKLSEGQFDSLSVGSVPNWMETVLQKPFVGQLINIRSVSTRSQQDIYFLYFIFWQDSREEVSNLKFYYVL